MITKINRMFNQIFTQKICYRVAFRHFRQCLTANDYFIIVAIICALLIALVLNKADEIDSFQAKQANAIQNYAQDNARLRLEAFKAWGLVASMLNGAIIIDGRLNTICLLNAAGDCR